MFQELKWNEKILIHRDKIIYRNTPALLKNIEEILTSRRKFMSVGNKNQFEG